MGDFIRAIIRAPAQISESVLGIDGTSRPPRIQPPSPEETVAQEEEKVLTKGKISRESVQRAARGRIITARAAGPQTLFTRPGQIPLPTRLSGGLRP